MNPTCYHRKSDGTFCKRWAKHGSKFCATHQVTGPPAHPNSPHASNTGPNLPDCEGMSEDQVLVRLAEEKIAPPQNHNDLVAYVSRVMAGAFEGRFPPGQTYAMGFLADVWLRAYEKRRKAKGDEEWDKTKDGILQFWGPVMDIANSSNRLQFINKLEADLLKGVQKREAAAKKESPSPAENGDSSGPPQNSEA